jgi:hypothetical protein
MRHFQFTIRGLLWATFWATVSFAAWAAFADMMRRARLEMLERANYEGIGILFGLIGLTTPFIAIGALFGRAKLGFAVGVPTAVIVFAIYMIRMAD